MIRSDFRLRLPVCVTLVALLLTSCSAEQKYGRAIERGRSYLQRQDYSKAIREFASAARFGSNKAEPHFLLGLSHIGENRPDRAAAAFRKALSIDPNHRMAELRLAELMVLSENADLTAKAQPLIQKVLASNPSDPDAFFLLAASEVQVGNAAGAESYLKKALSGAPQHLQSAVALAMMKINNGKIADAEEILQQAVRNAPDSYEAMLALGAFWAGNGRSTEAASMFRKVLQKQPGNPDALLRLAAIEIAANRKSAAEKIYQQLSQTPDRYINPIYGIFLAQENRAAEAVIEFERLARNAPDDRAARTRLIAAYLLAGRTKSAEERLADSLSRNPKDVDALVQRSQVFLESGRLAEAEQDLSAAVRYLGSSPRIHYLLARVFHLRGDALRERQEFETTLRLAPDWLAARIELASNLIAANHAATAISILEAAPAQQKSAIPFLIARNWALIRTGDLAPARAGVDQALAVERTPDLLVQSGLLHLAARSFERASAAFQDALKLDPLDIRALRGVTQSATGQGRIQEATSFLRQHAASYPESSEIQIFAAKWLEQHASPTEARSALKLADPKKDVGTSLMLARMDLREGKLDSARQRLIEILSISPKNTAAQILLGAVEESRGDSTSAIQYYREVLLAEPNNVLVLNNLSYQLSRTDSTLDEALTFASRAKEIAPSNPAIQHTLGYVYLRKKLYSHAIKELESAASLGSQPVITYHLGLAYRGLGESAKAEKLIAAALQSDPTLDRQ